MDNLQIWRQVERTDPDMTKRVEVGRKFTAIDAHYQIMRATEVFGPAGAGWGTRDERFDPIVCDPNDPHYTLLKYQAVLWFNGGGFKGEFAIAADIELFTNTKNGWKRMDDPVKKVRTDAVTKGLSWLGFNADVFMGKFDNQKYIQQVRQEIKQEQQQPAKPEPVKQQDFEHVRPAQTILNEIAEIAVRINLKGKEFAGWLRDTHKTTYERMTPAIALAVLADLRELEADTPADDGAALQYEGATA